MPLDKASNALGSEGDYEPQTEAFVALWTANQRRVMLYLCSLLGKQSDVDDLLQETSLVCWREFSNFQQGTNFGAWACTIAFNQTRAWRKRQARDRLVFSDEFIAALSDELINQGINQPDRGETLRRCIQQLQAHHRELIHKRYFAEQSIDSLAKQLNGTTDAIYRKLSRIRHTLHKCMTRQLPSGEQS